MANIHHKTIPANHFDADILNNTPFILSLAGILRADTRLRNKFRVQVLVAELFDLSKANGYAYCSNLFLSTKMGVSVETVKRDLKLLESCGYLRRDTQFSNFKRKRKIFVSDIFSNNFYQGSRMTQPSGQELPKEESLSPNGDKKDIPKGISKDVAPAPPPPSFSSDVEKLCVYLIEKIQSHGVKFKDPRDNKTTWIQWRREMDKLTRLDGRSTQEIKELIDFSHEDDFWCQNILSPTKLRKHAEKLLLQMAQKQKTPSKEDRFTRNKKLAEYVRKKILAALLPIDVEINCGSSYLDLGTRSHPHRIVLSYDEKNFEEKLKSILRKMNIEKVFQ